MKKLMIFAVVVVVLLFAVGMVKDGLIKAGIEKGTEKFTGLKLTIGSMKVGIIKTLVAINNMRIENPAGYQDPVMLDMPEIYVDYDLPAMFRNRVHLEEMRINLREFVVVKNQKGELNLNSLKVVRADKEGVKPEQKTAGKSPELMIDKLQLTVGKVVFKDYTAAPSPKITEYNVNLNERYTDIDNPYELVTLILVKAMMGTDMAKLADIDMRGLQSNVSDALKSAEAFQAQWQKSSADARQQAAAISKQTQGAVKQAQENAKKTQEDLQKAADSFKNIFGQGDKK